MLFQFPLGRAVRSIRHIPPIRSFSNVFHELSSRGFIQQVTSPTELENALRSRQVIYCGVDPTASSLHIGNLVPLMCLLHFQLHGHTIIPLIGGATGLIGDPSGRKTERGPANVAQIERNVGLLSESIKSFFRSGLLYAKSRLPSASDITSDPEVKSNLEWHQNFTMLEFLRVVGVHARVNTMLNKESVRTRLDSSAGISFTEFTYQLLQAYDFYHLHSAFGCTVQIGGSDQWGNIVAGLELINRLNPSKSSEDQKAFGITTPLLTTASGEKFGKSAGNAIWLDPKLTSVFDLYQYFLKVEDADVEKYLKIFTFLPLSEIQMVMEVHKSEPDKRTAQRRLAAEVTELIHGGTGQVADAQTLIDAFRGDPRMTLCEDTELTSVPVVKLASKYGLVSSTSAARQLAQSKGLYFNDQVVPDIRFTLHKSHLLDGRAVMIRAGKDKVILLAAGGN
ncbi:tyrosine-tRNA ligase [Lentinula edodes]|nr:tyrosine-tRNA ligase [Lentinula edodes]KAJ3919423.1 tyrosine-tRNA ligase [Lentinula edodes]